MNKIVRLLIACAASLLMMFLSVVILVFLNLQSNLIIAFVTFTTFSITYKLLPKSKKENNMKNAPFIELFHQNGVLSQKGRYLNEKRIGEWSVFNDQGEYIQSDYYEDGVLVSTRPAS